MAQHTQKFVSTVEKRGARGVSVRSAEGSAVGRTRSAAQDAKVLAVETAKRTSQLSARSSAS